MAFIWRKNKLFISLGQEEILQIGEGTHHLPTGNERQKSYLPECLHFKEMTLKSLRRHFWMLSKVATLRKGSLVVYNQVLVGINSKLFCQYSLEKTETSGMHTYIHIHKCTCMHNLLSRIGSHDYRSWEVPRSKRINEVVLVRTWRPENQQNWWYKFWSYSQPSQDKKSQTFHMGSKSGKYGYFSSRQSGRRSICFFNGGWVFLFYLGLQFIERGPPTLRRAKQSSLLSLIQKVSLIHPE